MDIDLSSNIFLVTVRTLFRLLQTYFRVLPLLATWKLCIAFLTFYENKLALVIVLKSLFFLIKCFSALEWTLHLFFDAHFCMGEELEAISSFLAGSKWARAPVVKSAKYMLDLLS